MGRTTEQMRSDSGLTLGQLLADTGVPVYVVTVERGRVIDVRLATRDFVTAIAAGQPASGEEAGQDA